MRNQRATLLAMVVLGVGPAVFGCNALTGADDLIIEGKRGGGGNSSGSGSGSGNGSANGVGAGSTGAEMPDPMSGATGVTVREVALYQGVKRPLTTESNVPIIQGRDGLLRVFYDTDGGYDGAPVTARLHLGEGAPIEVVQGIGGSSSDESLQSTLNIDIPAAALVPGVTWQVEILQPRDDRPDNPAARYPAAGPQPLGVDASPAVLRVELIPIAYAADGSNRTPDTSAGQLQAYRDLFHGMYPVTNIELTVHAVVTWESALSANGAGWDTLLTSLADFRSQENPPNDVYYYGIFKPTDSIQAFCGGGCVAGLGFIGGAQDAYSRTAIGLGFTGPIATETAVHEVGHNHGRAHAPCGGPAGPDGAYPYQGGAIGSWGWDIVNKQLFAPFDTADMMGYCQPIWVSDYTFRALFTRIQTIDGANVIFPPELLDRTYERVRIDGQGNATFLEPLTLHEPPMAEPTEVTLSSGAGTETVTGQLYRYDHLDGGVVFWPQGQPVDAATLEIAGQLVSAIR